MHRPIRLAYARAIALPRPQTAVTVEWLVAAIAAAVILVALIGP